MSSSYCPSLPGGANIREIINFWFKDATFVFSFLSRRLDSLDCFSSISYWRGRKARKIWYKQIKFVPKHNTKRSSVCVVWCWSFFAAFLACYASSGSPDEATWPRQSTALLQSSLSLSLRVTLASWCGQSRSRTWYTSATDEFKKSVTSFRHSMVSCERIGAIRTSTDLWRVARAFLYSKRHFPKYI